MASKRRGIRHLNREYSFHTTVNYWADEKDIPHNDWYPSIDTCLVAMRKLMEDEHTARSFVFSVVVRDHEQHKVIPMSKRLGWRS